MAEVSITPSVDGPYLVSGAVHLTDIDGREIPHPDQMALAVVAIPTTNLL
jgi:hypothetical protein